jgi:hypothetical protein
VLRKLALAVAPLLLGFVALALFDLADDGSAPAVTRAERAHTRLVVLIIDSLDLRDVPSLPALDSHERGLYGPVRACVDGVTIPCVTAMIRGYDRASGFSPLRNFGAARDLVRHSLLGAMQDEGLRVGYFGDPLLARALDGLTIVRAVEDADDERTLQLGLAALPELDVALIHLLAIDEAAHKFGAEAPAYEQARRGVNDAIARTFARLAPTDHLAVLGDHGHELSGRHSADIGTTTYAAYYGPRFARGVESELAMTDHAPLWGRLFGLRWSERTLADDYFAGRPLHGYRGLATRARSLLPLLLACAVAALVARALARVRPALGALALMVMLLEGVLTARGSDWLASTQGALGSTLLIGGVAAVVLKLVANLDTHSALLTGSLLAALPTAEPMAGIKAPMLFLLALLLAFGVRGRNERGRALLAALVLLALAMVRVQAFLPRVLLDPKLDPRLGEALPTLLLLAAVFSVSRISALSIAAGTLTAHLLGDDSRWLMLPCALVLPLAFAALRVRRCFEPLCFLLPIACRTFFPHDTAGLAAVSASWLLWSLVPRALREQPLALRAAAFVVLMWVGFWTAMSTRIGGIDYDFYFRWLPPSAGATDQAVQQGLLTAAKSMLPVVFGVLLALRGGARLEAELERAAQLTGWRIALTILFVVALSLLQAELKLLYDATQELAFWLLMYAVLGLISAAYPSDAPRMAA